jgi:hypothetical protein
MHINHRTLDRMHIVAFDSTNTFHGRYMASIRRQDRHQTSIHRNVSERATV